MDKFSLLSLLDYDPSTGDFRWVCDKGRAKKGDIAGSINNGYRLIKIGQRKWQAHRLAFLIMEGQLPPHQVDHINKVRSDNRWANLRHATHKQNHENRTVHEMRGVRFEPDRGKWLVRIKHHGITRNLGRYASLDEAILARRKAEKELFTHSASQLPSGNPDDHGQPDETSSVSLLA